MLFSRNLMTLIYVVLFVFTLTFILPLYTYAIDEDSIYVWSDNSSAVSTSNIPNTDNLEDGSKSQDNSRKFSGNNIR